MSSVCGLAALLGLVGTSAQAQTVSLDFNTPGEYTGNFGNPNSSINMTESATSGVSGGGGLLNNALGDGNSIYNAGSWDFSQVGDTINLSVMGFIAGTTSSGGKFQLGLVASPSIGFAGANGVFGSFRLQSSSTAGIYQIQSQVDSGGATTVNGAFSSAFALNVNDWYQFNVSFVNTGSSTYNMSATLFDYGTSGLTQVGSDVLVGAGYNSLTSVSGGAGTLAANAAVTAGWRVGTPVGVGVTAIDNFSAVEAAPEPQAWALLGLGLLTLLGARKRQENL